MQVASIIPSSRALIRRVAKKIDFTEPRVIAEFGPGEGCHTRELVRRMHPDSQLLLFELDAECRECCFQIRFRHIRLRFIHQGGATNGMDVTWRIEPLDGGCRVSIDHDFRPRVAPWAALIDRGFTRPIASRTLATFKAIAEALA